MSTLFTWEMQTTGSATGERVLGPQRLVFDATPRYELRNLISGTTSISTYQIDPALRFLLLAPPVTNAVAWTLKGDPKAAALMESARVPLYGQ